MDCIRASTTREVKVQIIPSAGFGTAESVLATVNVFLHVIIVMLLPESKPMPVALSLSALKFGVKIGSFLRDSVTEEGLLSVHI